MSRRNPYSTGYVAAKIRANTARRNTPPAGETVLVSDLWEFGGGIDHDEVVDACKALGVTELMPGDPASPLAPDEVSIGRWGAQRWPTAAEAEEWGWDRNDRRRVENIVTYGGNIYVSPSRRTITYRPD